MTPFVVAAQRASKTLDTTLRADRCRGIPRALARPPPQSRPATRSVTRPVSLRPPRPVAPPASRPGPAMPNANDLKARLDALRTRLAQVKRSL